MTDLAHWILSAMLILNPLDRARLPTFPEAVETPEGRLERYQEIAQAIADVVEEGRPLFGGTEGRRGTAATVLAVAFMESGFRRDVDLGLGKHARGGGLDTCAMQIRMGRGATTAEGWTTEELLGDRRKCFAAGLRLIRQSYVACSGNAPEHRLAAYASGTCREGPGWAASAARVGLARRILGRGGPLRTPTAPKARKPAAPSTLPPLGPIGR